MSEETPQVDIVTVLLHYGATERIDQLATTWRPIKCPFHDDKMASGSINVALGAYKCHACQMSGDGIKIIELQEGIGYGEAIEFARKVLGQSVTNVPHTTEKRSSRKPRKPRRFISV